MFIQQPLLSPLQQLRLQRPADVQGVGVHARRVRHGPAPLLPLLLRVDGAADLEGLPVHRGRLTELPDLLQLGQGAGADGLLHHHGPPDPDGVHAHAGPPDPGHVGEAVDLGVLSDLVAPVVLQRQHLPAHDAAEAGLVEDDVIHRAHAFLLEDGFLAALAPWAAAAAVAGRLRGQEEGGEAAEAPGGRVVLFCRHEVGWRGVWGWGSS